MSPKDEFEHGVKLDVEARVRQGLKAVLEKVLEEEMPQHMGAGYCELTPARRPERNGYYQRNLLTPASKIERLAVVKKAKCPYKTKRRKKLIASCARTGMVLRPWRRPC